MRYVVIQMFVLGALLLFVVLGTGPRVLPGDLRSLTVIAGMGLCLCALGLVVAAYRSLGPAFRVEPAPGDGLRLVTRGIYGKLRHPMYTAAITGSAGLFLLRPTLLVGLAALAVTVFYLIKARHEEGLLRRKYPEYADYVARSMGVLPIPQRLMSR